QVQVKILNPKIGTDDKFPLPHRATDGSAGIDLRACVDEPITIKAGESQLIGTGLAIYIQDPDYVGFIMPRSGLGHKHGIVLG
ncbi:dUTP diphosphatase, partial [Pseudonocardia sp. EV170527-09]